MNLKKATIEELLKEIERREKTGEIKNFKIEKRCVEIKNLNIKNLSTADAVVEYYIKNRSKYENGGPYFHFYFKVRGKKKLQDFYYGEHGLDYDEWQEFIPPHFGESSENCYEYHGLIYGFLEKLSEEEYQKALNSTLNGALEILSKCGYKDIQKIEPY